MGIGQDFSPAPRGGVGMGLYFLALLCPILLRVIIVNFSYLNKHININLFYSTQCGSLPLFCYVLYYEFFCFFVMIVLLNAWIYYSIFSKN